MAKIRYNFNPQYKLHKACCKDELRPALQHIFFKDGYAYASDAHIAVRAKVADITDNLDATSLDLLNGYAIHSDDFQKLLKYDSIIIEKEGVIRIEDGSFKISIALKRIVKEEPDPKNAKTEVRSIDFDSVICKHGKEHVAVDAIGINTTLLNDLRAAMGIGACVALTFTGKGSVIEVSGIDAEDTFFDIKGIIMPRLIEQ